MKKSKLLLPPVTHTVNECGPLSRIFLGPMKFLSDADADDDDGVGVRR